MNPLGRMFYINEKRTHQVSFQIIFMKTSSSGGLKSRQEVISSRRRHKYYFMKTSSSGGLQYRQEFISSRRLQNFLHEDLLVRRITRSPKVYLLEATSKLFT